MIKSKPSHIALNAAATIGSAAIAGALLYAGRHLRKKPGDDPSPGTIPSGEPPQTD